MSIDEEAGFTVTGHCRPIYSRGHNLRLPGYVEGKKHIDPKLSHRNVIIKDMGTEEEVYEKIFSKSIAEYNATKTKTRDKIQNYYQHVLEDARLGKSADPKVDRTRKPFYEFQFYIGDSFKCPCPVDIARKILIKFVTKVMPKKYPNFILTSVVLHNDEYSIDERTGKRTESAPHIHAIGILASHAVSYEKRKEVDEIKKKTKRSRRRSKKKWN